MMNCNLFNCFDPYVIMAKLSLKWMFFMFMFLFQSWPVFLNLIGWMYQTIMMAGVGWESFKSLMKKIDKSFAVMLPLFLSILTVNMTGLVPFVFTLSSHLSVNMSLSLSLWMGGIILSVYKSPKKFMSHLLPTGTPMILWAFLVMVESVSLVIRPMTLSIRLMANVMAGHLIINLMSSFISAGPNWYFTILESLFILFELCVSAVQAYVFVSLLLLYWDES